METLMWSRRGHKGLFKILKDHQMGLNGHKGLYGLKEVKRQLEKQRNQEKQRKQRNLEKQRKQRNLEKQGNLEKQRKQRNL